MNMLISCEETLDSGIVSPLFFGSLLCRAIRTLPGSTLLVVWLSQQIQIVCDGAGPLDEISGIAVSDYMDCGIVAHLDLLEELCLHGGEVRQWVLVFGIGDNCDCVEDVEDLPYCGLVPYEHLPRGREVSSKVRNVSVVDCPEECISNVHYNSLVDFFWPFGGYWFLTSHPPLDLEVPFAGD